MFNDLRKHDVGNPYGTPFLFIFMSLGYGIKHPKINIQQWTVISPASSLYSHQRLYAR